MSKIGKKPITIPEGVQASIADDIITIKGPKGELWEKLPPKVFVEVGAGEVKVLVRKPADRRQKALWGTFRSLLSNMVTGVTAGFERKLEVIGIGYKAAVVQDKLILNLGYSHPVELPIPPGLTVKVEKNVILVNGLKKQEVGQFAALTRSKRPPEPYKGKGVKYEGEIIRRKAGKVVKTVGT